MLNQDFWQRKKVLITGHTGFKGSWLTLYLDTLGAEVIGYALDPVKNPNLYQLTNIENSIQNFKGDIRDQEKLYKVIQITKPEIIFHLAAQSLVPHSYEVPKYTYETNVMGTLNLLESIKKVDSVKALVNVTSDKCYENNESEKGYREEDKLGGNDPYSSSKACAEILTHAYYRSFLKDKGIATARAGNVVGGGDWAHNRLVPDIIESYFKKQTLILRHPNAIRPWQHVLEALTGYLLLAEKIYHHPNEFSGPWNFGPTLSSAKTVKWLVSKMAEFFQTTLSIDYEKNQVEETQKLILNSDKAESKLKWQPRWNIEKTVTETILWYQAFHNQENMRQFSLNQISDFKKYLQ